MNKKLTQKEIAKEIQAAAEELDIHPSQLTLKQLRDHNPVLTKHKLELFGGITAIKKAYFPVMEKQLIQIAEANDVKKYINDLEKKLTTKAFFEKKLVEAVTAHLKPLPAIKASKFTPSSKTQPREIVAMLNDTHYGLIVKPEEIGNVNSFGWTEACRRTAKVLSEILGFKPHHRDQVERVQLVLNGDLLNGIIHGLTSRLMELRVHQVNGAIHILTHMISHLAANFPEVIVTGVSGNHEDSPHKRENGHRVTQEKYDSDANIIFFALSTAFRNSPHVKFNFPKTPYAFVNLPGGRAMVNHGDTLFSKALGYPGTSLNVKSLGDEIRKFNMGEVAKGLDPVMLMLFGHTHTFAHFITPDGVEVYNAPSLSGLDAYAHGLNINNNLVGQVIFESTQDFILGDSRLIRLEDADLNESLDHLIPVYDNELSWQK